MSIKETAIDDFEEPIDARKLKKGLHKKHVAARHKSYVGGTCGVRYIPISLPKLSILKDDQ